MNFPKISSGFMRARRGSPKAARPAGAAALAADKARKESSLRCHLSFMKSFIQEEIIMGLFGFGNKKEEEKQVPTCCCGGSAAPAAETSGC